MRRKTRILSHILHPPTFRLPRTAPHCAAGSRGLSIEDKSSTRLTNLPSGCLFSILWDDHTSRLRLRRRGTLTWHGIPKSVLLVKKWKDAQATIKAREMVAWLKERGLTVTVEEQDLDCYKPGDVKVWGNDSEPVDFCVTLGGDGTLLHLSRLLESRMPAELSLPPGNIPSLPPCISFGMGSLGFLTNHDADEFEPALASVLNPDHTPLHITLRTRLMCEGLPGSVAVRHVLNECVLSSERNMCTLKLLVDGRFVTDILADGLIISTPSGSTAYNMSAGGCLVAPSVPCTLLTPKAAHTLSFRPIVIHESSVIELLVCESSRTDVVANFDGTDNFRIPRGQGMRLTTSPSPLPLINVSGYDHDWFDGLKSKFEWNKSIAVENRNSK